MNHRFEGWFSSEDDFVSQQKKSILSCPLCESLDITRMPSAPYLASHVRESHPVHEVKEEQKPADFPPAVNDTMHLTPDQKVVFQEKMQATMLQVVREIMTKTEDVGESFAEEAKRYNHPGILFGMLDGKDCSQIIWKMIRPKWSKPFKKES